jgi:serine/threonine protein kinase
MEYVPNMHEIDLSTFSEERVAKLRTILRSIHEVAVCHCDPYPRNMMVQIDTDRVLWIDFDSAQTFTPGSIPERQQQWMVDEDLMVTQFVDALVSLLNITALHLIDLSLDTRLSRWKTLSGLVLLL